MQLSIVVPVYRSADCLGELARRVEQDVGEHFDTYELVLVNDCSPDESWQTIEGLVEKLDFVTGVDLRKNVGQDNAIMAGLHQASGDIVVIMDDDLQHDPRDIHRLAEQIGHGFDVVYADFEEKHQAWWKNLGSWFNDRLAIVLLGKPPEVYLSPYKAMRREVVDEVAKYDGPFTYVDGILFTITSNMGKITALHRDRFSGASNYTLLRSIRVWLKVVTNFSVIPLRMASVAGAAIAGLSFLLGLYFLIEALVTQENPEGWPSLIITVFFLGGIQLLSLGVLGEYIGRIFITMNGRPQFSVKALRRPVENSRHS